MIVLKLCYTAACIILQVLISFKAISLFIQMENRPNYAGSIHNWANLLNSCLNYKP